MLGIVIIGRNEGERLRRCLASVSGAGNPIVYVDSGSTDGSPDHARSVGADVVDLDLSIPFSAARARNEGLKRLLEIEPEIQFVQFVDGDCELVPGWIGRAAAELESRSDLAAVCGRLRERHPEASIYNRLCDMEWNSEVGEVKACGGIAMYWVAALAQVGGFNPTVMAGEEPELCLRLRQKGWKIVRLADEMALHDAAMTRFGQWWKRQVRGGYGGSDVVRRFDAQRQTGFARQIRSARAWGIGWPAAMVLAGIAGHLLGGPALGALCGLAVFLVMPMQVLRLAIRAHRKGMNTGTALAYGALIMASKWASLAGQVRYSQDRRAGRHAKLIEYKDPTSLAGPTVHSSMAGEAR